MAKPAKDGAANRRPPNPFGDFAPSLDFYPSTSHRKVVHRITRSLESCCGMVLVTGEIGVGKTSVGLFVREQYADRFAFVLLGNPFLTPDERVDAVLDQLGAPRDVPRTMDGLAAHASEMFRAGRPPVLIVDECHLLRHESFAQLQVLSNLREGGSPLVQMLLVGQVEIAGRLREPGMEAFNQRIGVRCEIEPMNLHDTRRYVEFKLEKAEHPMTGVFEPRAVERIWRISGGLPRLINHACSYALDQVTFCGLTRVTTRIVDEVLRDSMYRDLYAVRTKGSAGPWARAAMVAGLVVVAAMAVGVGGRSLGWWGGAGAPEVGSEAEVASVAPETHGAGRAEAGGGFGAASAEAGRVQPGPELGADGGATGEAVEDAPSVLQADARAESGGGADAGADTAGTAGVDAGADEAGAGGEGHAVDEDFAGGAGFRVNEEFADDPQPTPGGRDIVDQAAMPGLDPPYGGASAQFGGGSPEETPVVDAASAGDAGQTPEAAPASAEAGEDASLAGAGRVPDGAGHPVVGAVSINAVAWSEDDAARIAVLDGRVLREGAALPSGIVLVRIGKRDLLLEYGGALYRIAWSAQSAETE